MLPLSGAHCNSFSKTNKFFHCFEIRERLVGLGSVGLGKVGLGKVGFGKVGFGKVGLG